MATGGDDPDSCLPGPLKDFVFDLHDSARRSHIPAEQVTLYNGTFRELSSKYFATSAWPSCDSISSECGGDPLFLAFYSELTHRHLHSVTRPQVRDRIDGWHVYRNLFDLLLSEAPPMTDGDTESREKYRGFYILPEWAFDISHEFVYQFQGFCQFRTQTVASAAKYAAGGKPPPGHVSEAIDVLSRNRDAWAVETVLFYLHRLVTFASLPGDNEGNTSLSAYRHLGVFASVALSRLECLLGDYRQSLNALTPTSTPQNKEILNQVFQAKLTLAYHAGVSYLMLRRYKDATRILGDICVAMSRGFKTGQLRKLAGSDQFLKLFERMIALLAILTHICPACARLDDSIARAIRDKHGSQLSKIEAGEEGYEDLFIFACPKFVTPALPDYSHLDEQTSSSAQDVYRLQIKHFISEMNHQRTLRKLRSYMKLYTSIKMEKLAGFNDAPEKEFLATLLCYKHKMRQLCNGQPEISAPVEGRVMSALDIHYYIVEDMVHVSDVEKTSSFEQFFMKQIAQSEEIMADIQNIDINF